MSYLAKAGLQASSIKVYLAALRHTQIARTGMELEHSKMPKLKILQSGIRRTQALLPKQSLTRLPITPAILRKIKEAWSPRAQEEDIIMLWAASALCFFGFFCMGELTTPDDSNYCAQKHLSPGDIAIDSHCMQSFGAENFPQDVQNRPRIQGGAHFCGEDRRRPLPSSSSDSILGDTGKLSRPNVSVQGQNTFNKTKIYFSH